MKEKSLFFLFQRDRVIPAILRAYRKTLARTKNTENIFRLKKLLLEDSFFMSPENYDLRKKLESL